MRPFKKRANNFKKLLNIFIYSSTLAKGMKLPVICSTFKWIILMFYFIFMLWWLADSKLGVDINGNQTGISPDTQVKFAI